MNLSSVFRTEMTLAMGAALALALALLALRPSDRTSTRNMLILLGFCALVEAIEALIGSMGASTASALIADVASVLVGVVLIRLATIFVFRVVLPALRAESARIVEDLTTVALILAWALTWLRFSGVDLTSLVATSAVITAVLAFSMQETLGNVLGGIVLQIDRSVRVGDWVKVEDTAGRVVEITWRYTAVQTRNRETVFIPNGWLMKNRFTVIGSRAGLRPGWRRWIRVNVDFSAAPTQVCAALEKAVKDAQIPHVAADPPPHAVLLEIGPRYGGYALRYWLDDPEPDDATDSQVRAHLLAALARHGFKLGVPYQEELAVKDNPAHREAERLAERERRLAALGSVELFAALSQAERDALTEHLVYAPFVAGDVITYQGAVAHWLYLIVSGEAEVSIDTPRGRHKVAALAAGDVFGEMGMLTGEPRRATVGARTDVVCYRLDKAGFETVIKARPDVAEAISKVLARRETDLEGRRAAVGAATPARLPHGDILARIRGFFGLDS
ncbi:MAG TPA: mechanosensitive ion channel family protein [Usitatibacter sp.]|nr:mechanosensitive ion channel family protein [Usitatibacter sp.]